MENVDYKGMSDTVYTLNFGTNAACRLEQALGADQSYDDVMRELRSARPRVTLVRQWVRAALVNPKPDTVTLEQVGDIIDDLGGWTFVLVAMDSQSPVAIAANEAIRDALKIINDVAPNVKPADESVTH